MRLAQLYEQTGRIELAEAELREVQELAPTDRTIASELLRLLTTHKQYDKATALVSEFMARYPQEGFWPMQLGGLMLERKEYAQAVSHFHRAIALSNGENVAAVAHWLQSLARAGRAEEAVASFEQMTDAQRLPVVRVAAGEAFVILKRRGEADEQFGRAIMDAAGQSFTDVLFCAQRIADVVTADDVRKLLETLAANPPADENAASRLRLALASFQLDKVKDAAGVQEPLRLADQVIASSGEQTPERVQALLVRARALELANDVDGMVSAYEQVLAINDRNLQALNNLAYALADRFGRAQEALVYAQRANEVSSPNANVLDTVGWVYFLNNRIDEAQAILADALRMDPDSASIQYHMGELMLKSGRVGEARGMLRRAGELAAEAKNAELTEKIQKALEKSS
jgi:tetratricopeptide (TPR) repeat protein